jgi:eukaryotic-like serine/threonine-protein kinase
MTEQENQLPVGYFLRERYKIIKYIGKGSFGVTYLAEDIDLPFNHRCIVKCLKPESHKVKEIATRLFQDESKHLYKLGKHDQIPCLYARFEENSQFYLVQEYIDGDKFSDEISLDRPYWNEEKTIEFFKEILEILAFVHEEKIIHRDIKPDNIIRRKNDGKLVLIDFGAVKEIRTTRINPQDPPIPTVAIGPEGCMPIEQVRGYPKLASDIYLVGVIGILGLTGKINTIEWRNNVKVSDNLAKIIDKMIHDKWEERYQNADEALKAFNDIEHNVEAIETLVIPPIPSSKANPLFKGWKWLVTPRL